MLRYGERTIVLTDWKHRKVDEMNTIERDELRAKLEREDGLQLVMALPERAYRAKRIPGTRHFETVGEALDALDPGEEVVVYCATVYCPASIYVSALLEREGYRRVYRYAGGIDDWESAGYPVENGAPRAAKATRRRRERPVRALTARRWPALA
jgi:rhodanese-related sulfurtransferase